MAQIRILFLSANPRNTARLSFDEEFRAIQLRLRQAGVDDEVVLCAEVAVRAEELPSVLERHKPRIIHFSGHGGAQGQLLFVGADPSSSVSLSPETLHRVFKELSTPPLCVVLNACHSILQARRLTDVVPCVVGMSRLVKDEGAIAFAAGFYEALATGDTVRRAFVKGCTQSELNSIPDQSDIAELLVAGTADADRLTLRSVPPQREDSEASRPPGLAYDLRYYVGRSDHESLARQMLQARAGAVVLRSPEWCGKTWLLEHLLSSLTSDDILIRIDAKELSQSSVISKLPNFLREFSRQILDGFPVGLQGGHDIDEVVNRAIQKSPNLISNMRWFMEQHILSKLGSRRMILAMDSVDIFITQPWCDEFFSMLRSWQLRVQPLWSGLRFLFTMSTAPNLLVKDIHQSPFNGASKIILSDFTATQIAALAQLYGLSCTDKEANLLLSEIGGHPYLLALACYHARHAGLSLGSWLPGSGPVFGPFLARAKRLLHADAGLYSAFKQAVLYPDRDVPFEHFDRLNTAGFVCKNEESENLMLRFPIYRQLLK